MAEALDVGIVFGFDHDTGQRFRAGVTQNDAAVFAERGLRFGEGARNFRQGFERRLRTDFDVEDGLGIVLESFDERFEAAVQRDERGYFDRSEKAVAGGRILEKNNVAGLLAAEHVAATKHLFENVAVADVGASQRNVLTGESALESEIGHGSSDNTVAGKLVPRFEEARRRQQNAIAIHDLPRPTDEEGAVSVTIESDAQLGALGDDAFLQASEVERTAIGVDVAAVGRSADGNDLRAQRAEKFRAELVRGAVGAIENDAQARELRAGNEAAAEKGEILGVERFVGHERFCILRCRLSAMLEDIGFESFLDRIREFHSGVREELDAVVVIRIVRSGDNHAGLKIVLTHEAGNPRSGDDPGEGDGNTGLRKARGEKGGDMRPGFARVHADEGVRLRSVAAQISAERTADGIKRGVVERRSSGNTTDPIRSEEFFGHEKCAVSLREDDPK